MTRTPLWRLVPGAALLLLAAGSSMALTLGRAQGVAVLGRPLDVTVPVVLDPGLAAADLCARATVLYGETPVDARHGIQPTSGQTALVRVRVPQPVNEAFVTVQVRVGCTQTLSREFVLLTQEPSDIAEAAVQPSPVAPALLPAPTALPVIQAAPAAPAAATSPAASPAAAPRPQAAPAPRPAAAPKPAPAPRAAPAPKPAAAPKPMPVARAAAPVAAARPAAAERPRPPATRPVTPAPKPAEPKPATVERPRLKLDAAEITPKTASTLKSSGTLQEPTPAPADAPQRAEAAAQWQALNTSPDDLLLNAQRMVAIEADMRAMRESMLKNQAMLAEMRTRLDQAERERYANPLVYALAGLLAAALALAGVLHLRARRVAAAQSGWWADRSELGDPGASGGAGDAGEPVLHEDPRASAPDSVLSDAHAVQAPATRPGVAPSVGVMAGAVAGDAAEVGQPRQRSSVEGSQAPVARQRSSDGDVPGLEVLDANDSFDLAAPDFSASAGDELHDAPGVSIDELCDLQQQASFFASLGEYDRAIAVLRAHIDVHPQGSAVAWLELLDVFHRLQRKNDYEQLRRDFEWLFNSPVPAFDAYSPDPQGLEAHPERLAQVQGLWGTPAVLPVIEQAVMGRAQAGEGDAIGLEAMRDLLFLHGVANDNQAVVEPSRAAAAAPAAEDAAARAPADAPASAADAAAAAPAPAVMVPVPSLDALQIDAHPSDDWKKLAPPNSKPMGLDLDLDDLGLDLPPADAPAGGQAHRASLGDENLLDFDLDLTEEFKLPKK